MYGTLDSRSGNIITLSNQMKANRNTFMYCNASYGGGLALAVATLIEPGCGFLYAELVDTGGGPDQFWVTGLAPRARHPASHSGGGHRCRANLTPLVLAQASDQTSYCNPRRLDHRSTA
jgi:hypothetical protein